MKLWEFRGPEVDWVAADSEADARAVLRRHYGISDEDITGSYESISVLTEARISRTAAKIMSEMRSPGLVASTYQ